MKAVTLFSLIGAASAAAAPQQQILKLPNVAPETWAKPLHNLQDALKGLSAEARQVWDDAAGDWTDNSEQGAPDHTLVLRRAGSNGDGTVLVETTLGRLMLRLIHADSGGLSFAGDEVPLRPPLAFRQRAQIVFQNPDTSAQSPPAT